jgi:hypothetical protein
VGPTAIDVAVADPSGTPAEVPAVPHDEITVLDFEFVGGPQNGQPIGDYYNGGTSGGVSPAGRGPNHGVTFSSNALGLCRGNLGGACSGNFAGAPSPNGVLFFLGGPAATMNVASGFSTGFSFFYSAAFEPGFVRVFDDVNGTGNVLATIDLAVTPFTPGVGACAEYAAAIFCPFVPIGVTFSGTARSVDFGGTGNQIAFDNITFGLRRAGRRRYPRARDDGPPGHRPRGRDAPATPATRLTRGRPRRRTPAHPAALVLDPGGVGELAHLRLLLVGELLGHRDLRLDDHVAAVLALHHALPPHAEPPARSTSPPGCAAPPSSRRACARASSSRAWPARR